jgi:nucleotide-binding universal stress UspA family protein
MATMIEETTVAASPRRNRRSAKSGRPIIVATDGSPSSDAALCAAQAIALHTLLPVQVVAVYAPRPIVVTEVAILDSSESDEERCELLRSQVQEQFARIGLIYDWPIEIPRGDPAATIAQIAEESDASLVVMGLSKHGLLDRLLGEETVLRVLRLGRVPVLAASPSFTRLPLCVLAATDFSPSSARALSLAGSLTHPLGAITLAHVAPDKARDKACAFNDNGVMNEIHCAFDRLVADAELPRSLTLVRRVWPGDPADVLVATCRKMKPDLVVVGSHGHGFLTRLMIGSVSERLVRDADTSVLIAPRLDGPGYLDELPPSANRFTSYEWAERLEEFTRRNASRLATLEIIDPEIGAQIAQKGFPFIGASYDLRDGRVQIMLGDAEDSGGHLTHTVRGITALQVLRDRTGRDLVLRIAQERTQTLLTLE